MFRLSAMLIMGIALGYGMFFTRLEGRSIASHLLEVVESPVVQDKLNLVGREGSRALRDKLSGALPRNLPGLSRLLPESPGSLAADEPPPALLLPSLSRPAAPAAPGALRPRSVVGPGTPKPAHAAHSSRDRQALGRLIERAHQAPPSTEGTAVK